VAIVHGIQPRLFYLLVGERRRPSGELFDHAAAAFVEAGHDLLEGLVGGGLTKLVKSRPRR
jgi:hypothetical protein